MSCLAGESGNRLKARYDVMERLWYIKHCRLFDQLSSNQLSRLEQRASLRQFPKKTVIYLPHDAAEGVCLLVEGRVKLCSLTPDGKEAILALIEPGELFGEMSLVSDSSRDEHAEAMLASTVVLIPGDEIINLMANSPQLALGVTKLIGWRRMRIERRLKTLLFRSNRDRVVHLLLDLAEQYGQSTGKGVLLSVNLSHQNLASIIGATRETATSILGELQLDGLLTVSRQRLLIRNIAGLARCVDAREPVLSTAAEEARPIWSRSGLPASQKP